MTDVMAEVEGATRTGNGALEVGLRLSIYLETASVPLVKLTSTPR